MGISVSVVVSDAKAALGPRSVVNVGRDLFVQADTIDRNYTNANAYGDSSSSITVAAALHVADFDLLAAADGTAIVGRNVNVTTQVSRLPVEGQKGIFFPSYFNGTSAQASIDPAASAGDPLNDLANSLTNLIATPVTGKVVGGIAKSEFADKLTKKGARSAGSANGSRNWLIPPRKWACSSGRPAARSTSSRRMPSPASATEC